MGFEGHFKVMSGGFESAFHCTAHFKMTNILCVISDMFIYLSFYLVSFLFPRKTVDRNMSFTGILHVHIFKQELNPKVTSHDGLI